MPFMQHPDLDAHVEVPESAVRIHEKSGWTVVALADLPKAELIAQAEQRGVPITKSARKAEIAEAIESYESQEG